jgi:hypothetical protein
VSKRDLSAVGDVADEVRARLGTEDLSNASADHVNRAIHEFLLPSDETFLEGMAAARNSGRKSFRKPALPLPEEPAPESTAEEILPDCPRGNLSLSGSCVGSEASLIGA